MVLPRIGKQTCRSQANGLPNCGSRRNPPFSQHLTLETIFNERSAPSTLPSEFQNGVNHLPIQGKERGASASNVADTTYNFGDGDNAVFMDSEFPHDSRSIGSMQLNAEEVEWIPARKLCNGSEGLFEGIGPNDLLQGQLCDCWLMAALASLAEFPKDIRNCFVTKTLQKKGKYILRLYDHHLGQFVSIVIDEFIPCHASSSSVFAGEPLFARPRGNQIWVLLIEKAIAKFWGSYTKLQGGNSGAAFRALTGESNAYLWIKQGRKWFKSRLLQSSVSLYEHMPGWGRGDDSEVVFKKLKEGLRQNLLTCVQKESLKKGTEFIRNDGLVEGHAYSLLRIEEPARDLRLLCLRNPWGEELTWRGPWSNHDPCWDEHPEIKRYLYPKDEVTGIFWMSWQDFASVWDTIFVCCREAGRRRNLNEP